ncbi:MAG: AIPR family protein [Candidatus Acidiferrales bacterium]
MSRAIEEEILSQNDVLGLNAEYDRWVASRTSGFSSFARDINPFDVFCAEQFLKPHVLLSDQDVLAGIVGKSDDGGVDSFYFILNGMLVRDDTEVSPQQGQSVHLVLIQTKEGQGFSPTSVDKFETFTDDLLDLTRIPSGYGRKYHNKLLDLVRIFKDKYHQLSLPKTTIDYYYITRKDVLENQGCEVSAKKVTATARRHISKAVINDFHFINAAKLYTQIGMRSPTTKTLSFAEIIDAPEGWIGLVSLPEFYTFLKDEHGERNEAMFDDNVRGFQRETAVNQSIQETLSKPAESPEFWLLNNGVTVLSSNVQPKSSRKLEIADPQIVNGLQTSRQVYAYYSSGNPPSNDKRRILVRVIQNSVEDVRDKVIKATNNQNPMPAEALFTTFRIHKQIETVFLEHNLYYERRKGFYRDQNKPISQIVTTPELIPAVIAIMTDRQDDARGRPKGYIQDKTKRWSLFGHDDYDDAEITGDQEVLSNPPFGIDVYLNCVLLVRRVDQFLDTPKLRLDAEAKRNIRFYLAKYSACDAIKNAYCSPGKIAEIKVDEITDESLKAHLEIVRRIYRRHGGNDDAGRSPKMSQSLKKVLLKTFAPTGKHHVKPN